MSKKTMFVSDKSGTIIADGQGAKVRITYHDARRGIREADLTVQEAEQMASELNARQAARRGRKPQSQS